MVPALLTAKANAVGMSSPTNVHSEPLTTFAVIPSVDAGFVGFSIRAVVVSGGTCSLCIVHAGCQTA